MKTVRMLAMLFVLCISAAGCQGNGRQEDDSQLSEVRIAYFPNITHAQALVMKGQGTLEEKLGDETAVKWIAFNAGPAEIEALFASEIDIGYIGPVPAISGYVQSAGDLRVIAGASNGGSVLLGGSGAGITEAADLDGKTVAVPQFGNTQHLSLLSLLSANGLKPTASGGTVEVVQSANADIANLMDQGSIDAALVPEPWGSILERQSGAEVVLDYDEVDANGVPSTALVIVAKDFLDAHSDVVETFMEAHKDATLYVNEHPEAKEMINAQIAEVTQSTIDADVLDSAFERLDITYQIPAESIMDFAEVSVNEKFIEELPDETMIDNRFVE